jgi:formate hydrogenlyase subunit 6/NADH:ubiquinone oxidoreductase subunit I
MTYFRDIKNGIKTITKGLGLTSRHLWNARNSRTPIFVDDKNYFKQKDGLVTLQYPHEALAVPEIGRYKLHNEIDDCIVCDKCAKVCPVDCIDIEAIKSPEIISYASDGSPIRLYAGKFDIDMAKCCFCGLCTTVCPTECLTMTNEYDFSTNNIADLNFVFGNLTTDQAEEKKRLYEQFVLEKEAIKQQGTKAQSDDIPQIKETPVTNNEKPKPVFKPSFKKATTEIEAPITDLPVTNSEKPKPVFKPSFKKPIPKTEQ